MCTGIVVGMVLAMLMFSDMTSRIHSEMVMTDHEGGKKYSPHDTENENDRQI